jgi:hypothetical protein
VEEKALGSQLWVPGSWVKRRIQRMSLLWSGATHKWRPLVWITLALTVALAVVIAGATLDFFGWRPPVHPDASCARHAFGCGVAGGALVTVFAASLAFSWLILVRVFRVVNWGYAREARRRPSDFVPTAADMPEVVGRDDLCRVIEHELREQSARRPQVIVGGVGAGKTAVLVRLTQWLADRGAVPVAVRLRDMKEDMGFRELAARRFRSVNEGRFRSDGEADRIWRRLCADGVVVVLADGLEEALCGTDARETSIRQALDEAHRAGLPLVVTSRPDDALVTLDAALVELGPLDEEQALDYVRSSRRPQDRPIMEDRVLRALMSAAKVAEMPLYLQLTRDLYAKGLFKAADLTDLEDENRLEIRLRLLETWRGCVEDGRLGPDLTISKKQREDAIADLSAVAAVALLRDTLELEFKDLRERLVQADPLSARLSANIGARLGIVETLRAGVRFRHSIMQAYLGSIWIRDHALAREDYLQKGLVNSSREFLMALTMACARWPERSEGEDRGQVLRSISERLCREAAADAAAPNRDPEDRRVRLLAAAYEIDRMVDEAPAPFLNEQCLNAWPKESTTPRVVEAKRQAIDRIAEMRATEAYEALYELCICESDYRVRLLAAQHLGSGGDRAIIALRGQLRKTGRDARAAKRGRFERLDECDIRRFCLQGWVLPLLVATAEKEREWILGLLDQWVEVCDGAPPSIDACLAQGFKYEANRVLKPGADRSARERLVQEAHALIDRTDYWYTRLTLLHAMTLWMFSEDPRPIKDQRQRLARWAGEDAHPFVKAAADLCASALASRNPSPYIWIDETGIVAKLGQQSAVAGAREAPTLWLTDSLGWVALRPRAVRLVADAMVMLNLTDGQQAASASTSQLERTRKACGPSLPPCVMRSGERANLGVLLSDGERSWALPGVTCAGSCRFNLCPYPQAGRTLRPEFSEPFCRHLATLRGRSPWHEMGRRDLQRFWREMERRARTG